MKSSVEAKIEKAVSTSDMFQILSMLLHLPTQEVVVGVFKGALSDDIISIFEELDFPKEVKEEVKKDLSMLKDNKMSDEKFLTELRQEYTRLFIHPKQPEIAIYETLFRYDPEKDEQKPSLYISPAAMDAERCYKKAGLTMTKEFNEPSDHMATEMEFMMYLYIEKAKALNNNQPEEIARREAEIEEFENLHLNRWTKEFFDNMVLKSRNDFYRIVGKVGSVFMGEILEVKTT